MRKRDIAGLDLPYMQAVGLQEMQAGREEEPQL